MLGVVMNAVIVSGGRLRDPLDANEWQEGQYGSSVRTRRSALVGYRHLRAM
jgi:hypothetical protein